MIKVKYLFLCVLVFDLNVGHFNPLPIPTRRLVTLDIKTTIYARNLDLIANITRDHDKLVEKLSWNCFKQAGYEIKMQIVGSEIFHEIITKDNFTSFCSQLPTDGEASLNIIGLEEFSHSNFGEIVGLSNSHNCIAYSIYDDKCGMILLHEFLHTVFRMGHFTFSKTCSHILDENNVNIMSPFHYASKCINHTSAKTKMGFKCSKTNIPTRFIFNNSLPLNNHNGLSSWDFWQPPVQELFYKTKTRSRVCKKPPCASGAVLSEVVFKHERQKTFPLGANLPASLSGQCLYHYTSSDNKLFSESFPDGTPCFNEFGVVGYCFDTLCVKLGNDSSAIVNSYNRKPPNGEDITSLAQLQVVSESNTVYCALNLTNSHTPNLAFLNKDSFLPPGLKTVYWSSAHNEFTAYGTTACYRLSEYIRLNDLNVGHVRGIRTPLDKLQHLQDPVYKRKCSPILGFQPEYFVL